MVVAFLAGGFQLQAQDDEKTKESSEMQGVGPVKGDFTASLNFGSRAYLGVAAPQPDLGTYTISSPSGSGFDISPSINIEGKYFISDKWAVKLLGGLSYSYRRDFWFRLECKCWHRLLFQQNHIPWFRNKSN